MQDIEMAFHESHISSFRPDVFCKKDVLKTFAKFTGKHVYQSLWYRTPFIEHLWWLLLSF